MENLEARVGFEPTNGGFADLSLRPLGYRAGVKKYSETAVHLSVAEPDKEVFTCGTRQPDFYSVQEKSHTLA